MPKLRSKVMWAILLLLVGTVVGGLLLAKSYGYRAALELPLITEIQRSEDAALPYSIGFVQFNDEGRFRSRSQVDQLLSRIQSEALETGAVVVLFVHGWNNTCKECSEEVQCFRRQLAFISQLQKLRKPAREVYGVYVGWNGVRLEPIEANIALTFEDRTAVADQMGKAGDLRELIEKLGALRRSLKRRSVFIASGHSLGGRAVFKAMTADVATGQNKLSELERFSDLLLLFNQALPATDYLAIDEEAARRAGAAMERPEEPPKLLVLGSESDRVTQLVFPFSVDRWWLKRLWEEDRVVDFTTVGHFSPYYTHRLTLTDGKPSTPKPLATDASSCGCTAIQPETFRALLEGRSNNGAIFNYAEMELPGGEGNSKYHVRLVPLGVRRGPYAVVQVDGRLMQGHSGIYTPAVTEFITRVANKRFFSPGAQ